MYYDGAANVYSQLQPRRRPHAAARADAAGQLCHPGYTARWRAVRDAPTILARLRARAAWQIVCAHGTRQPAVAGFRDRRAGAGDLPGATRLHIAVVVPEPLERANLELCG